MGTKFGHISVFDSSLAEARKLLKISPKEPPTIDRIIGMMEAIPGEKYKQEALAYIRSLEGEQAEKFRWRFVSPWATEPYYVKANGRMITIFSENYEIGTVENTATVYSEHTPNIVLATAIFDDSVFLLSLFKNGKVQARHYWGETKLYFGFDRSLGDASAFSEAFGVPEKKAETAKALIVDNLDEQIATLSELFGVELGANPKSDKPNELAKAGWKKVAA